MKLYLVRHGRQSSPRCNVDVSLAPEGCAQARYLGERLKRSGRITAIYSSALLRAVQTADILGEILAISPESGNPAWNEIDFGSLTGHTDEEIETLYGDFMKRRRQMDEDLPFPEGECGGQVWERAYPQMLSLAQNAPENAGVVLVTHGGVIRSVVAGVLGLEQRYKLAIAKSLENCSMTILDYRPSEGRFFVEVVNDFAHLEEHPELLRASFARK